MAGYIGSRASVVSSGAERKKTFDITGTTTVLTGLSYTPTFVHLFHNGVRLVDGTDYTATDSTSITLTTAAQSGDQVVVVSYATFQAADAYTKAEADAGFVSDPNGVVTIAASGNVGIGTSSPDQKVHLSGAGTQTIRIENTNTNLIVGSVIGSLEFEGNDLGASGVTAAVRAEADSVTGKAALVFDTGTAGAAAERMRIDSSGKTWINGSSMPSGVSGNFNVLGSNDMMTVYSLSTLAKTHINFNNPNGIVGTIRTTGSSTAYNTASDYRLKENITPVQGAADIVKAMQPVTYNFKADSTDWHDGFLAHELQELHPRAVSGEKDAVDEEGNPEYQGVDYSKLTPILTAALQEALNKIDALEARLTALEVTP